MNKQTKKIHNFFFIRQIKIYNIHRFTLKKNITVKSISIIKDKKKKQRSY